MRSNWAGLLGGFRRGVAARRAALQDRPDRGIGGGAEASGLAVTVGDCRGAAAERARAAFSLRRRRRGTPRPSPARPAGPADPLRAPGHEGLPVDRDRAARSPAPVRARAGAARRGGRSPQAVVVPAVVFGTPGVIRHPPIASRWPSSPRCAGIDRAATGAQQLPQRFCQVVAIQASSCKGVVRKFGHCMPDKCACRA